MTTLEEDTKILKDFINRSIEKLEKGGKVYVSGGYICHSYEDRLLDSHCNKIVAKLVSLGYEYTTNHGFGCKDWAFTKAIEL